MRGPMINFLRNMTSDLFGQGLNKKIYLIKDECHQATSNLDEISEEFFTKVINFSATPNLGRDQVADVQITESEAIDAGSNQECNFWKFGRHIGSCHHQIQGD